jgi:hypothetical protein
MALFLKMSFQAPGFYQDATQVSWKVFHCETKKVIQEGLLVYQKVSDYGAFDDLQKFPQVTEKDVQGPKVAVTDCKTPHHIREFVWQTIQFWKKTDPRLIIGVSGGWEVWSHFLHRLIHDDFARRRSEQFPPVVDIGTINVLKMFPWLPELQQKL